MDGRDRCCGQGLICSLIAGRYLDKNENILLCCPQDISHSRRRDHNVTSLPSAKMDSMYSPTAGKLRETLHCGAWGWHVTASSVPMIRKVMRRSARSRVTMSAGAPCCVWEHCRRVSSKTESAYQIAAAGIAPLPAASWSIEPARNAPSRACPERPFTTCAQVQP